MGGGLIKQKLMILSTAMQCHLQTEVVVEVEEELNKNTISLIQNGSFFPMPSINYTKCQSQSL